MIDQASEGFFSPILRNFRISKAIPYIHGNVLDVGCGTGYLANYIEPQNYTGFDISIDLIKIAKNLHPFHKFSTSMPSDDCKFDTIIGLAVIEHIKEPITLMNQLTGLLSNDSNSKIILTTPNPKFEWIHDYGSKINLFSRHANEEHESLLDYWMLNEIAKKSNLKLIVYKKFLFGANQLFILKSFVQPW